MASVDILLVEDSRHDIEMILDAIIEYNMHYRVFALHDGAQALDYFFGSQGCLQEAAAKLPKLILLDLKLPKVTGLEVLKRLKTDERTRYIPIVIFTSSNEYRDELESYKLGVNSYTVKPLDSDKFSRYVADIAAYWLRINETIYET